MRKIYWFVGMTVPLLTACGGGSDVNNVDTTRTYASDYATPVAALAAGKLLTAQQGQVAAINTDYADSSTSLKNSTTGIIKNSDGELSLVVNGQTYAFTADHRTDDGRAYATDGEVDIADNGNQEWKALISHSGTIASFLDGTNTNQVALFKYRDVEGPADDFSASFGEVAFMVVGTETSADALNTLTVKSYDASLRADIFPADGFESTQNRTEVKSKDLTFTVNFEENTIQGVAENLQSQTRVRGETAPGFLDIEGTLTFSSGTIDGTDFSGNVSVDDALKAEFGLTEASGDFSGTFYGTDADAIGGVFSSTTESAAGNKSNWVGGFVSN